MFRGRVNGMLAVSRALGDFLYKAREGFGPEGQLVSCVPDVRTLARDPADDFLILACDGVWEKVSNDQAAAFARGGVVC